MTAVGFVLRYLFVFLALAATAYVAGALLLRPGPALRQPTALRRVEQLVLATSLGWVVLGNLLGLLGLAGGLSRTAALVTVAAIHLAGWRTWRRFLPAARDHWRLFVSEPSLPGRRAWILPAAGLLFLAPLFVLALYPPSAFDETLYHLPMARAFAASGGLPFLPELRHPVFPQLAEVLSAALLLVSSDIATHLFELLANLLTAGILAAWAGARFGAPAGGLAAALWLGHPIVTYLGSTAYVEPLLALFVTAACWSVARWRGTGERAWLVLGAVFAASAADVKYLGLFFVAALAAVVLFVPRPPRGQDDAADARWPALAIFLTVAALVLLPWYGRIVAWTGNPVFPYLPWLFGESAWERALRDSADPAAAAATWTEALRSYISRLVALPWDPVFRRARLSQMPPFSPLFLVAVPMLALAALRARARRSVGWMAWLSWPAAVGAIYILLLPLLPSDSRYLVPVLPLIALGMAAGLSAGLNAWVPGWRRRRIVPVLLALLAFSPGWLYALYRLERLGRLPTTPSLREAHLARLLPVYPAVARLNRDLVPGERAYLLYAEEMRYHVHGDAAGDWFGPDNYRVVGPLLADPAALARRLRASDRRYLLIGKKGSGRPPRDGSAWQESFTLLYDDAAAALYALR